jgi:hypothetical protein
VVTAAPVDAATVVVVFADPDLAALATVVVVVAAAGTLEAPTPAAWLAPAPE